MREQPRNYVPQMVQTRYYDAHCSGCGEVTTADKLAFDFGTLINTAVEKASNQLLGGSDKWLPLLKVDLGYYLVWRDLEQSYDLRIGQMRKFVFTVGRLRALLEDKAEAPFQQLMQLTDFNNSIYNRLVRNIQTPMISGKRATRQDIDVQEHAQNIMNLIGLCTPQQSPDENEVIAEFGVIVELAQDDNGNEFAKQLEVAFEDGDRIAVINNVCPHCGKKFYSEVGKHQEIIICMAGSARVGKTAYLASLVDSILTDDDDYLTIMPSNDPEWKFFNEHILKAYQSGQKIDKTAFEGNGETIPLFSLEIQVRGRSYIFTFVDMPGEAFDSDDHKGSQFILNDRRIVKYASMIWFCVDPQQISASVAAYGNMASTKQDQVNTNVMEVMANIQHTLQAVSNQKKNACILITKSDMILGEGGGADNLYEPQTDVVKTFVKYPNEIVDVDKLREYADRSYQYLTQARQITKFLGNMFANFNAFSIAAIGKEPSSMAAMGDDWAKLLGNTTSDFKNEPSLAELPFIWTMAALNLVPSEKMQQQFESRTTGFGPWKKTEDVYVGDVAVPPVFEDFYHVNRQ